MIMAMISAFASRGRLPLDGMGGRSLADVGGRRKSKDYSTQAWHGNSDAAGRTGDGAVDGLGSVNEPPDRPAKRIGDQLREALLLLPNSSRHP